MKAITGATVINSGSQPLTDAVVVIEGTRITRVGPRQTTPVPPNATVIEAAGKFVIPGLRQEAMSPTAAVLRLL